MDLRQNLRRGKQTKTWSRHCHLKWGNHNATVFAESSVFPVTFLIPSTMALTEGSKNFSTSLLKGEGGRTGLSVREKTRLTLARQTSHPLHHSLGRHPTTSRILRIAVYCCLRRLQSGIETLCEERKALFIVKLRGVLELRWRREDKKRKQAQEKTSGLPSAYARALAVTISAPW